MPPYGYDLVYCDGNGNYLMTVRFLPHGVKHILNAKGRVQRTLSPGDGLMTSKEDRAKLVLGDPERVRVVRQIFDWYVTEGLGFKSIAGRLNREGVPSAGRTKGPDKWCMTTIRDLLSNPAYVGDMVWNRRSFSKFHSIKKKRASAKPKTKGLAKEKHKREDWIVTRDTHPAIVSRRTFDVAMQRRKSRRERCQHNFRWGRGVTSPYLLTGLVVCSHCGHNWQGYTQTKGKPRKDGTKVKTGYYGCGGYISKGNSVCQRSIVRQTTIEGFLFEQIGEGLRQFVNDDEGLAALRKALVQVFGPGGNPTRDKRAMLQVQKEDLEQKIFNILDNITPTTREFADKRVAQLKEELESIQAELECLDEAEAQRVDIDAMMPTLIDFIGSFEETVAHGTIEEKRRFLRAFVRRVELDPTNGTGRVELYDLPVFASGPPVQEKKDGHDGHPSSLRVVAGARYVVEKKIWGTRFELTYGEDELQVAAKNDAFLGAARIPD